MGDCGVSVPSGDCLPYLELKFKEMIGKDPESLEAAAWLSGLQKTAMIQARHVYCVGMHSPLPFETIYQPTRLRIAGASDGVLPEVSLEFEWPIYCLSVSIETFTAKRCGEDGVDVWMGQRMLNSDGATKIRDAGDGSIRE